MDEDRIKHALAVARKMQELNDKNLDEKKLFLIGYLHDIGYEFTDNKLIHNIVGGEILKENNFEFWKEIYYHGIPSAEYSSEYLTLLNKADMMIDNKGNDVGCDKRLENIKIRYGEGSIQYINAKKIIGELDENSVSKESLLTIKE